MNIKTGQLWRSLATMITAGTGNRKLVVVTFTCSLLLAAPSGQRKSRRPIERNENLSKIRVAELTQTIQDALKQDDWRAAEHAMSRICELIPHDVDSWIRLAHYRIYIVSALHDDVVQRYEWRRRGIVALLDGLSANPDACDLATKVGLELETLGLAEESMCFAEFFTHDKSLHELLGTHVDFRRFTGADKLASHDLAARLFLLKAIELTNPLDSCFFASQEETAAAPTRCLVNYARSLQAKGQFDVAVAIWCQAEAEWAELARQFARTEFQWLDFDYWVQRCRREQDDVVVAAHAAFYSFKRLSGEMELESQPYQVLFRRWHKAIVRHPELLDDRELVRELYAAIETYFELMELPIPPDFLLMPLVERHNDLGDRIESRSDQDFRRAIEWLVESHDGSDS